MNNENTGEIRKIDTDTLQVAGRGANAVIYRLDDDKVVKVYNPGISREVVAKEFLNGKLFSEAGVRVAKVYELITAGDEQYGIVTEYLKGEELLSVMKQDRSRIAELSGAFGRAAKQMHGKTGDPSVLRPIGTVLLSFAKRLETAGAPQKDVEPIMNLFRQLPQENALLHGDLHPGNAISVNKEPVLIDLSNSGCGHPVFDLTTMCSHFYMCSRFEERRQISPILSDVPAEDAALAWDSFLKAYLDTEDEAKIRKAEDQIVTYTCARDLIIYSLFKRGVISPEHLMFLKKRLMEGIS